MDHEALSVVSSRTICFDTDTVWQLRLGVDQATAAAGHHEGGASMPIS